MFTHAKGLHTHVKDPVVYVKVWWIMETPNRGHAVLQRFASTDAITYFASVVQKMCTA